MAGTAAIVLKLALRLLADLPLGATVPAALAASQRNAIGMAAIAAIVLIIALRVLAGLVRLLGATVGATEIAT